MKARRALAVLLTVVSPVATAACSGGDRTDLVAVADSVLIDVRTPAEFADGHLPGALNIPVESDEFLTLIGTLDPDATYGVYCRSGNRSAYAVDVMRDAGFANLVDLGGLSQAADATGLEVVS